MSKKIKWVILSLILNFISGHSFAEAPLEIQTITSSPASLHANSVLIKGEKNMVLVDVPFTRSDTYRVIADILETGKKLETVIISHDHPDHFFGLDLIIDTFPDVKIVAHPQVVKDIRHTYPIELKRWKSILGMQAPHYPGVPEAVLARGDEFWVELEGKRIEIFGTMQGDHIRATVIWVPSIKALIAGDLLYNGMFLWLGEHSASQRLAWRRSIEHIEALKPEIVVAGHKKPDMPDDLSSIKFSKHYLDIFEKSVASSKNSNELTQKMKKAFPNTIDVAGNFLLTNSTRVAMGEMPPWED